MKHEKGFRRVTIALSVVVFVVMLLPVWNADYLDVDPGYTIGKVHVQGGWVTRTRLNVPLAFLIVASFTPWYWGWHEWSRGAIIAVSLVFCGLFALIPWAGFYGIRWVVGGFSGEDRGRERGGSEGQG